MIYGNWHAWDDRHSGTWQEPPISEKRTAGEVSRDLAEAHVEWFLSAIRPLLIDFFNHGFKHGVEWAEERNRKRYP